MNLYKLTAPIVLKKIFDLGIPFRSKILSIMSPRKLFKEGEFVRQKETWYGLKINVDLSYYIESQIYYYNIYEPEVISFLDYALDESMNCLDLGTNIGLHTMVMSKKVKQVISYEANPKIVERLKRNVVLNSLKNVTINNKAIAPEAGEILFSVPKENAFGGDGAIGKTLDGIDADQVKIKADSISAVLKEKGPIDFIKIDVEGIEFDLIQSSISLLKDQNTTVLFEYNSKTWSETALDQNELFTFFNNNDYILLEIKENYRKSGKPLKPQLLPFPTQNNFIVNIVALHKNGKVYQNLKSRNLI